MSFNPLVSARFAAQAPHIVRGLVVSEEDKSGSKGRIERMLSLWRARPAFLAYDVRDLPSICANSARRRGLPVMTWTGTEADQDQGALRQADQNNYERRGP